MAVTQESIDFTVMYATHNAFRRDLDRLRAAAKAGKINAPAVRAGWENFKRQLHVHHSVEDSDLWPRVEAKVAGRSDDKALLEEMEQEHGALAPTLAAVEKAIDDGTPDLVDSIDTLATVLGEHMKHEEEEALPLIQEVLTRADWKAFSRKMGTTQGLGGAAVYVPWITDSRPASEASRFLDAMPGPVRIANRLFWESRYQKRKLWEF